MGGGGACREWFIEPSPNILVFEEKPTFRWGKLVSISVLSQTEVVHESCLSLSLVLVITQAWSVLLMRITHSGADNCFAHTFLSHFISYKWLFSVNMCLLCHTCRSLFELLAEGRTLPELCENLHKLPDSQKVKYVRCHAQQREEQCQNCVKTYRSFLIHNGQICVVSCTTEGKNSARNVWKLTEAYWCTTDGRTEPETCENLQGLPN